MAIQSFTRFPTTDHESSLHSTAESSLQTLFERPRRPLRSLSSWEVEVEAFLTTLEVESDCDDDSMSTASTSDSSSALSWEADSSAASLPTLDVHKKPKFRSSHARQKHEKNVLRKQIEALEEAIRRLSSGAGAASPGGDSALAQAVTKWKQTALTQREQLQRARSENKMLRRSALDQKRMAKGLERILLKRIANNLVRRAIVAVSGCATVFPDHCSLAGVSGR